MLVHTGGEAALLDFFVDARGPSGAERRSELVPVDVDFGDADAGLQRRRRLLRRARDAARARRGAASGSARCRWPSSPRPAVALARDGRARSTPSRPTSSRVLAPILTHVAGGPRALRAGGPAARARATSSASRTSATRSSASAPRARSPSTAARSAAAIADWVLERGGTLAARGPRRLRAGRARARQGRFRGREVAHQPAALARAAS